MKKEIFKIGLGLTLSALIIGLTLYWYDWKLLLIIFFVMWECNLTSTK